MQTAVYSAKSASTQNDGGQSTFRTAARNAPTEDRDSPANRDRAISGFAPIPVLPPGSPVPPKNPASFPDRPALPLQRKLAIGAVNDPLEQEADSIADHVMRTPEAPPERRATRAPVKLNRKCSCDSSASAECNSCKEEKERLHRRSVSSSPRAEFVPPIVHRVLGSRGRPLDSTVRAFFEPRFENDLSHVRLHTGDEASRSARAVGARAYTVGSQIVCDDAHYAPHTDAGRRLIAHEIAHVFQQSEAPARRFVQRDSKVPVEKQKSQRRPTFYFSVKVNAPMNGDALLIEFVKQFHHAQSDEEARKIIAEQGYSWQNPKARATEEDAKKGYTLIAVWGKGSTEPAPSRKEEAKDFSKLTQEDRDALNAQADAEFWALTHYKPGTKLGSSGDDRKLAEVWKDLRAKLVRQKKQIDNLSPTAKEILLGTKDAKVAPEDLDRVARIASKLMDLTPEELEDYKAKVTRETASWDVLEDSIDRYLAERARRKAELEQSQPVKTKLYGLEETYRMYRIYELSRSTKGAIAEGADESGDLSHEFYENEQKLIASVKANGFKDLDYFQVGLHAQ